MIRALGFLVLIILSACQINANPGSKNPNVPSSSTSSSALDTTPPSRDITPVDSSLQTNEAFTQLSVWPGAELMQVWPAWQRNCAYLQKMKPEADLGKGFTPRHLARACEAARHVDGRNSRDIQSYFERYFSPIAVKAEGKFTGYFEPIYEGSRKRGAIYKYPLYRLPKNNRLTRQQIDHGAVKGMEIVYLRHPVDIFVLQIQGSALIKLAEGGQMRVGYAGNNGAEYVAIGKPMADAGLIARDKLSMQSIIHWLKTHPDQAKIWMDRNPRYIFFREVKGKLDGPLGAMGAPLFPGHSLAVDTSYTPLGLPIWLVTTHPKTKQALTRLVIAQDKGAAIKGPQRADLFWGSGEEAALLAGPMNEQGNYYILKPNP